MIIIAWTWLSLVAIDAIAADTIKDPYCLTSSDSHDMRIINSGLGSLYARIDMIRRAKTGLDIEAYIFNPKDKSSQIILQELEAAAKRGVKVRMLLDKAPLVMKVDDFMADEFKKRNIEVRFYNPGLSHFRNHRKAMVRDGEELITGGRNFSDEYYDLSEDFNFLDRDASVEGPIVSSIKTTFDNFWNSKLSKTPRAPQEPVPPGGESEGDYQMRKADYDARILGAKKIFEPTNEISEILKTVEAEGKENFLNYEKKKCPEVTFVSDKEGALWRDTHNREEYMEKYRLVYKEILHWMDTKVGDEFILDTPYFLHNKVTEKILTKLKARRARIKLFTNSLASTDAIPVSSAFTSNVASFTPFEEFKAFVFKGKYSGEGKISNSKVKGTTWGTHSKTMIFNDNSFMIGSFNVDNRSIFYNTELAVFCNGSPELTKDVRQNIQKRMDNSFELDANADGENCDLYGEVGPVKKLMYYMLKIPSLMFQHLL